MVRRSGRSLRKIREAPSAETVAQATAVTINFLSAPNLMHSVRANPQHSGLPVCEMRQSQPGMGEGTGWGGQPGAFEDSPTKSPGEVGGMG